MGSNMRVLVPVLVLLLASTVAMGDQAGVSSCDRVVQNLTPCDTYVGQGGAELIGDCCIGLVLLKEEATTPADRQTDCYCAKAYLAREPASRLGIFAALPNSCNVDLSYKLDLTPDCNSTL